MLPWESAWRRAQIGGPLGVPLEAQLLALLVDAWTGSDQGVLAALMGTQAPTDPRRTRRTPTEQLAHLRELEARRRSEEVAPDGD